MHTYIGICIYMYVYIGILYIDLCYANGVLDAGVVQRDA